MAGYIIETKENKWEVICGLEIHCQIISKSKMFSGASTVFGADANEHVSFVDAGMPGMLPVLNERCVHQAVKTGLGLNAKINKYSQFSRKNYFYADLPQGYQITQFQYPIVGEGKVLIKQPKKLVLSVCILSRMPESPFMISTRKRPLLT